MTHLKRGDPVVVRTQHPGREDSWESARLLFPPSPSNDNAEVVFEGGPRNGTTLTVSHENWKPATPASH